MFSLKTHPMAQNKRTEINLNFTPKQWFGLATVCLLGITAYYAWMFGFGPLHENLWGDYRAYNYVSSWGIRIKRNTPLTPDKFFTLTALCGNVLWLATFYVADIFGRNNALYRALQVGAVILLLPFALYMFVYASVLLAIGIVFFLAYLLIRALLTYIVRGKVS